MMAIDQTLVEEHIRGTDQVRDIDSFMSRLMRGSPNRMPPVIPQNSTRRCKVSMTRPTNTPGVSRLYM